MTKLKLKLWQIDNVVLMKVLEQDESTRGSITLLKCGAYEIVSADSPMLGKCTIYVRGRNRKRDHQIACLSLNTTSEATGYIQDVKNLVRDYNNSNDIDKANKSADEEVKIFIAE